MTKTVSVEVVLQVAFGEESKVTANNPVICVNVNNRNDKLTEEEKQEIINEVKSSLDNSTFASYKDNQHSIDGIDFLSSDGYNKYGFGIYGDEFCHTKLDDVDRHVRVYCANFKKKKSIWDEGPDPMEFEVRDSFGRLLKYRIGFLSDFSCSFSVEGSGRDGIAGCCSIIFDPAAYYRNCPTLVECCPLKTNEDGSLKEALVVGSVNHGYGANKVISPVKRDRSLVYFADAHSRYYMQLSDHVLTEKEWDENSRPLLDKVLEDREVVLKSVVKSLFAGIRDKFYELYRRAVRYVANIGMYNTIQGASELLVHAAILDSLIVKRLKENGIDPDTGTK